LAACSSFGAAKVRRFFFSASFSEKFLEKLSSSYPLSRRPIGAFSFGAAKVRAFSEPANFSEKNLRLQRLGPLWGGDQRPAIP
jgi:hypothetical protein